MTTAAPCEPVGLGASWRQAAVMEAVWREAFDLHMSRLPRASFVPPVVVGAPSNQVLVVCPPWRYSVHDFAHEVQSYLRHPRPTIVVLNPPFEHAEGGREWFAYAAPAGAPTSSSSLMHRLGLEANDTELAAALATVRCFVETLSHRNDHVLVTLFGSSQGASVAAHVGAACTAPNLRRVAAYQPAGFYVRHWRPQHPFVVEVDDATHGDLSAWRGRLGHWRTNRTLTLFFGRYDVVAPLDLVRLVRNTARSMSSDP